MRKLVLYLYSKHILHEGNDELHKIRLMSKILVTNIKLKRKVTSNASNRSLRSSPINTSK